MSISLRQIRYFVSTAEQGQISQAAVDLSISQSAITTAIKDLERIIGAELFVRSSHGMELTLGRASIPVPCLRHTEQGQGGDQPQHSGQRP